MTGAIFVPRQVGEGGGGHDLYPLFRESFSSTLDVTMVYCAIILDPSQSLFILCEILLTVGES